MHRKRERPNSLQRGSRVICALGLLLLGYVNVVSAATPLAAGFRDFSYPSGIGSNSELTAEKPESKVWFNDGFWWGSLWRGSATTGSYTINRFDPATQDWIDTGVRIDDRKNTKADALWDGTNTKLYVVSHLWTGSGSSAAAGSRGELFRFSYNAATDTYTPDSGFPVEVNDAQTEALVIDKDSTGRLWVTYVKGSQVFVNHSGASDTDWAPTTRPFVLPVGASTSVTSDDMSSLIAYNGRIGVLWSNQNTLDMYFASHPDGSAPDQGWQSLLIYGASGDDHMNLKKLENDPAGRVFAAIKTSQNSKLIVLLRCANTPTNCTAVSDWQDFFIYDNAVGSTRPQMLIDTTNRDIYVFTRNKLTFEEISYKVSDLDAIDLDASVPHMPFIKPGANGINDPTSTKQNVSFTTGLLGIASEAGAKFYLHNYFVLGPPAPEITVTPASHNYGSVNVGQSGTQSFNVKNDGGADLIVSSSTLTGTDPGQFMIGSGGGGFTLTPGQSQNIVVTFNPTSGGAKSAALRIDSNDADEDPLDVPLSGTGTTPAPDISVTPATHNYGNVQIGSGASRTFTARNDGNQDLSVTSTSLVGTDPGQFSIISGGGAFTLMPGTTRDVVVSFSPTTVGTKNASLSFASNDPDENPLAVPLTGIGVSAPPPGSNIAHEETKTGGSSASSSVATSTSLTGVSNHLYLAAIATRSPVAVTLVSGLGLTWTKVDGQCAGRNQTAVEVWKALGTPTGNTTVIANLVSAPSHAVIAVSRYSGVDTVSPIGQFVSGNTLGLNGLCTGGADSAAYSFNLTTMADGSVAYGAAAMRSKTHTPGSGYTERAELIQGAAASVAVEDKTVASASTVAVNGTFSGAVDWAMVGVEIKPAAGGGPNSAPVASNVAISGTPQVGQTLTGSYSYADAEGDAQGISTFRWLRNDVAIGGATASTYALVAADEGAMIKFEVTPVAQSGTSPGSAVQSAAVGPVTAAGGGGTVTHQETVTGGSSGATTVATAGSLSAVSGNLYLAAIATKPNVAVGSVAGLGLTWSLIKAQCAGRGNTRVELWQGQGTASGSGVVTATLAASATNAVIAVSRYSGVSALGNLLSGNSLGANGACSGGTDSSSYSFNLTTTVAGALAYGAVTMRGKTHTPGAGYTERVEFKQGAAGSEASVAVEDMTVSAAATVPVNGTLSGAVDWAMVGVEIRP